MAESSEVAGTVEAVEQAERAEQEASFARLVELRKAFLAEMTFDRAAAVQAAVTAHADKYVLNRFELNMDVMRAAKAV
ncbi:hypothetical protein AB0M94_36060 [Streptomyces xanthochromogenes]|uniref:hypothetical protein n=1 Tax=Streptomyces xanthochromogenes TaxID=67384 RepID=UPI00343F746C